MKKFLIALSVFSLMVSSVVAATITERECSTDNYGNTTCRDKVTDIETGVITYTNAVTTTRTETSTTTGQGQVKILNTAAPAYIDTLAMGLVALGAVSGLIKLKLGRKS
jgi:hypothetical protein